MENQINAGAKDTPRVEQNSINQSPVASAHKKPRLNYWMISTIVIFVVLMVGGYFYFLGARKQVSVGPTSFQPQPSAEPSITRAPTGFMVTKSNQIRKCGLQLTYPDVWTPIFAALNNGKNAIFFAKTAQEAQTLAGCALAGSCNDYSLELEVDCTTVWQNSTVEDFIKQAMPDIQLSNLQKTTINGRDAWLGYTNSQKTKHQAVIVTSAAQPGNLVAITASATNVTSGMIEEYIARLLTAKVSESKAVEQSELMIKKGFIIELTSSLNTQDFNLINFIIDNLLAPKNSTSNYNYFLYADSMKSSDSGPGGPSYPKDNYLNGKYYLLTDNDQLSDGMYGTSQVQIKLSTPSSPENLGLYLADPKYCQQDTDCLYRANFCTIGAFNSYHQFIVPWGCGTGDFEGLGNSEELRASLGCQTDVEVKFDSLKCISNRCQVINARAVCKQ